MSRSGYSNDYDADGTGALWRGAVTRSIKGKRGQALLRETLAALDAMPEKALAAESLVTADGEFCTLGALGAVRGLDMLELDPDDWNAVAKAFNVAPALVREIVYENDEAGEHLDGWHYIDVEVCGPVRPFYPEYGSHRYPRRVQYSGEEVAQRRWARMRAWVESQITPTQAPSTAKKEGQT
jgi:hypothetical protein